jgi:hypothetical protein
LPPFVKAPWPLERGQAWMRTPGMGFPDSSTTTPEIEGADSRVKCRCLRYLPGMDIRRTRFAPRSQPFASTPMRQVPEGT